MNIAMWSGPRNLSTAMMYAFGMRRDCAVWDEPFYAAYLAMTDLAHPMRDEILAAGEMNPDEVAARLVGAPPDGKMHFYQKHMTHHMIDGIDREWMKQVKNVFLIRHPSRVIASYAAKRDNPSLDDIGLWQQAALVDMCDDPIIIDSSNIRENPEEMLRALCAALELPFDPAMLSWPMGGHKDDGVWAPHWYDGVHNSTGFTQGESALPILTGTYAALSDEALPYYQKLAAQKLCA
ncbi:MAG: hypothetical protein V3V30_08770 [Parvularculaceae bacterium]